MQTQRVDLGFRPRDWQATCFKSLKRFSVLVIHRRAGKTVMAVMKLIDAALRNERQAPRYAYLAPLFNQAKDTAWSYLKHYAGKIPGARINESETWIELPNGARIRIYGADNPDRLRGIYLDGVVLDEVADMKPEVWDEVVLPTLADRGGWALFIGTPKGVNRFSELYDIAGRTPGWFAAMYDVYQTGALPPSEIEMARETMPPNAFRQEYLCDFSAANENTLIGLPLALSARGKNIGPEAYDHAARIIGVDVARYGDDSTVIQRRQGLASWVPKVVKGADAMQVAAIVALEMTEWKADAVMVDGTGGYGAGVIDRLRQMGFDPVEVQFAGKPMDARFANKRAEMWWGVKDWLEKGGCLPDDMELIRELSAPTYSLDNARGVLQLESKEDIKERIRVSPDRADALALTFAFPVAPNMHARIGLPQPKQQGSEYDPWERDRIQSGDQTMAVTDYDLYR